MTVAQNLMTFIIVIAGHNKCDKMSGVLHNCRVEIIWEQNKGKPSRNRTRAILEQTAAGSYSAHRWYQPFYTAKDSKLANLNANVRYSTFSNHFQGISRACIVARRELDKRCCK